MFLELVLSAPTSQRAAASVLRLIGFRMNWSIRLPCANSGRLWMVRVGLYALICEKTHADDWLWMVDHTVQLGPWKCLVIVGIRLSIWRSLDRPLRHEDLSLLNLTPMKTASKEAVAEQLLQTCSQTGQPLAVLSDEGTELKGGMRLFQEQFDSNSPQPLHLLDIKHKAAALLKKQLGESDIWDSYVKHLTRTKLEVTLTSLAFLNPPRLRNKARFMNLIHVVKWGRRALRFVKNPKKFPDEPIDRDKLEAKLGWLRDFEKPLREWSQLLAIIRAAEKQIRCDGYHQRAAKDLKKVLKPLLKGKACKRLANELLEFVKQQSSGLKPEQHVIGHTEVLESVLGKYKQIQGRHNHGGMTASLLNIGAAVVNKSPELIQQALRLIPVKEVTKWVRDKLGQTIASKQKLAFN